jgi:glycosyltransferase involved in cell wall biosynthesis
MANLIRKHLANGTDRTVSSLEAKKFEYGRLTASLAELFDRVGALHRSPVELPPAVAQPLNGDREQEKTAVHLAYFFPPIGGAGAQRSLKFVRYLPMFGYRSVVVTGVGDTSGRWTPADETLSEEIDSSTDVRRVGGPEPAQATGWKGRAQRWLAQPTEWSRWWISGVEAMANDLSDVDVILASMSPYETAEAAVRLAQRLGKPWVAGLRDPWALDEMMVFPTAWHRRRELRRMRELLSSAAAIMMTTPESVVRLHETFPELRGTPIVSIPNGFDAADFENEVQPRDDGVFRIVHTGYLHTELGLRQHRTAALRRILGGQTKGVDILTRSHVYLLEAVERLVKSEPSLRGRLEVHLAGVLSSVDRETATRSDLVRLHEYLPHADALELIRTADLLFLPMQNLPAGMRSTTVPGKTYEYLASGRPILAAVPEGDARDIVLAAGNSHVTDPDDTSGITEAIRAEVNRWLAGEEPGRPAPELVARYERRFLTAELATLLGAVIGLSNGASIGPFRAEAPKLALVRT